MVHIIWTFSYQIANFTSVPVLASRWKGFDSIIALSLADNEAIGETVYIKICLHVMIYVQKVVANFAFISQVSFLSTEMDTFIKYNKLYIIFTICRNEMFGIINSICSIYYIYMLE